LDRLAAATPSTRDRYVDFLRAFSIAVVVFGHWLVAIVYLDGSGLSGASALEEVPAARVLTWVLQVMPLFFFVGGFSNLTSWRATKRKGGDYFAFVSGRVDRLMRPCAAFIGIWVGVAVTLHLVSPSLSRELEPALAIIAKPLWFIAVYLIVIALAPAMLRLHERFGVRVPVAMAIAAATVDLLRLALDVPLIGYLNFAFVWLFAHQLGFFYGDGRLAAVSKPRLAAGAAVALLALVALTQAGPYSTSMVGVDDGRVSNNDPPSICIVAHSMWLISAAMLVRRPVTRWLQGTRPWRAVIAANSMIMTVFLWHLTALLVGVLALYPLGFPQPAGGSAEWWLLRPVWLALLVVLLVPFVVAFGRFERGRSTSAPRRGSFIRAATAIGGLTGGMAGFATAGFGNIAAFDGALTNAAYVGTGILLLGGRRRAEAARGHEDPAARGRNNLDVGVPRLGAAVVALCCLAAPSSARLPADAAADISVVGVFAAGGVVTGAVLEDDFLYVATTNSLSIYDVSDPAAPELLATRPSPRVIHGELISTGGELLLLNGHIGISALDVWNVEDKSNPVLAGTVQGVSDEHFSCLLQCTWAYGSNGSVVDLRVPQKPELYRFNWKDALGLGETRVHRLDEYRPGFMATAPRGSAPLIVDVRRPLEPRVVAKTKPPSFMPSMFLYT
ncbi:MAG: acyltransferase family protein, partial [Actinomycetota bacterium]|nr:acyltransferase family protein [Actinomycetota bacterium]